MSGFTEEEREQVRAQLLESGKQQVVRYGPTKTTIEDITQPVGIATSTFYLFFDSKDEFYLQLIQDEIIAFQEQLATDLGNVNDATEGLLQLFEAYADFADDNPLVQQVIIQNNYQNVFQSRTPDKLEQFKGERMGHFQAMIQDIQELDDGDFGDIPAEFVIGVLSVLGLFALHKEEYEEFGSGYGDNLQSLLVRVLANGLTSGSLLTD